METKVVETPKGRSAELIYRENTSDLATIGSTWRLWGRLEDEYSLADLPDDMAGTAIDIGAHIGSVAVALLLDHPRLRVVAVEPLEDNCRVIALNAERLGVADRITIITGGISDSGTASVDWNWSSDVNEGYWATNRYIGNVTNANDLAHETAVVPGVTLASLMPKRARVPFLKIDCEGCEWIALADPAVRRIDRIAGEYHGHPGPDGLAALLGATHTLSIVEDGACGIFRAVRR